MAITRQTRSEFGLAGLEQFNLKDYLRLLLRRKWFLIMSFFVGGILAAVAGYFIPNVYRATTVILVDPRKVPDNYVPSTVSSGVADRLATLRQQVLSATRLTQIMDELKLYTPIRDRHTPEELVEMMRKNIEIEVGASGGDRGLGAFKISFQSSNAAQSAEVTNRLASLFIEENVKARAQEVQGTADFIDRELEDAKKDLQKKEDEIRQLKSQYVSDLPESQTVHVQAMNALQLDLRSEMDAIDRAQQQKVYFQSQLAAAPNVVNLDREGAAAELMPLQTQLAQAQTQLDSLRSRYGSEHPDVIKKKNEIKDIERRIHEAKDEGRDSRTTYTSNKSHNPVLESQITALDEQIKQHTKRSADIKSQLAYHESKLEHIPLLEQRLAAINRDYENARDHYKVLMDRKFSADMSSSLETYQKGERFIVLDPAQVPERPYRPNRSMIHAAGLSAGLIFGLALVIVLEMFDPTIKTIREVKQLVDAPVLAEIPVILTQAEQRRNLLRNWLGAASCTASAVIFGLLVFISQTK